jgi:hypothetical protein
MNSKNLQKNMVNKHVILAMLVFQCSFIFAQNVTINSLTGGIATSPLAANAVNQAILGIQFDKAGGGTNAINGLIISLTEDPLGRFTNVRLIPSNNNNSYDAADLLNSPVGTVTVVSSPDQVVISGSISAFGGNSGAETRMYFLVVNIDASVSATTASVQASLPTANVTLANNSVLGSTVTGINYSFVDTTTPTLTLNPIAGAVNVAVASNLVISFDEAIRNINDSDIDNANVGSLLTLKLTNAAGVDVPFTASINAGNDQIIIDPTANLNSDQVYYLNIAPVEDASNNATAAANITFTTVDTQPPVPTFNPLNGATGVVETNNIVINFNEAIRRASDNFGLGNVSIDGRITLKITNASGGDILFDATINGTDDQVTIIPDFALPGNTIIYVAIAGVEDGNDNLISPDPASITFTTGDTQPPTLTFNPVNNATGISVSSNLTITFNEAIRNLDNSAISAANLLTLVNLKLTNAGGADVPFVASIDGTNTLITIDPTSNLAGNQVYFLRMNPIEDGADNATSAQSITFTSEAPPSFTGSPFSPSITCVGDNIVISGNNFGAAIPTVTVNGTSTTPAEIIAHTNTSITFKTLAGMAGSSVTVTVLNNTNGLNNTSVSTITINPAIALSLPISANPFSPAVGQNYNIQLANSQTTVNYRIRELPSAFSGGTTAGTGSTLSFGPSNKGTSGTYQYEIQAQSAGCSGKVYGPLNVVIASLAANAGSDKTICQGETVLIGGSPTAIGGTGFHQISWSGPGGFTSSGANPSVSISGTYTVTITDNSGSTDTDNVLITVNASPVAQFISLDSIKTNFSDQDSIYFLSNKVKVSPPGGTKKFSGLGVVEHAGGDYYFDPTVTGVKTNLPIAFSYIGLNNCIQRDTLRVNVSTADAVLNLEDSYCSNEASSNTLSHNPLYTPASNVLFTYTYKRLGFYHCNSGFIAEADPNNPMVFLGGGNYRIDIQKATNYGSGCFAIIVWYTVHDNINFALNPDYESFSGYKFSEINYIGKLPSITSIRESEFICANAPAVQLLTSIPSYITNNFTINDGPDNSIIKSGSDYFFDPSEISFSTEVSKSFTITYNYNDDNLKPTGGCQNSVTRNITVVNLPEAPTSADQQYCQFFQGRRTLSVSSNIGSTEFYWFDATTLVGKGPTFDTQVSTANASNKLFTVRQAYLGCQGLPDNATVIITPSPSINFTVDPQCQDRLAIIKGPNQDVVEWTWNFGDGSADTTTTTNVINHVYQNLGNFNLKLFVKSVDNGQECFNSTEKTITVGQNPKPIFTFNQVCDGDNTQFQADADINVQKFEWTFGDGDFLAAGLSNNSVIAPNNNSGRSGGTYKNPTHRYFGGPQDNSVMIKAYTSLGCFDSTTIQLTILPFLSFSSSNPYQMKNLDSEKGFWSIEDARGNTTWEFAKPAETILNYNEFAWTTNAIGKYLPNDLSYVNSPCFNISGITKPVLTLDYLSNTPKGSDGAVLQYTTNGITWSNVGSIGSGKKWFNEVGIPFGGGNNQGWSGDLFEADTSWVEGKRILDDITPRSKIRFRIAFYSSQEGQLEGFAFKNVKIEPRNRQLLVENFTNAQAPQVGQNNTAFYNLPSSEIVKLEYHTSFPAEDNINSESSEDQNSRAAFYGLTNGTSNIPRVYLDGESSGNLVLSQSAWFFDRSLFRALDSSPYEIIPSTLPTNPDSPGEFIVHASIKANQIVIGKPIVHLVVVEKTVGSNQFVVRKFLPHAAGTPIPNGILATSDSTFSLTKIWQVSNISNFNQMAIVVFIQDEETKEVYQAEYLENPGNLPSEITDIEPDFDDLIFVYPNPAKDEINIELPKSYSKSLPIKMMDAFGREVYNALFNIGEQKKTVKTSEFASGVYIIQIKSASGEVVRKKIIVAN